MQPSIIHTYSLEILRANCRHIWNKQLCCTQFCLLYILNAIALKFFKAQTKNNPPSPAPAFPLAGHLHLIEQPLHRALYRFSQKSGPIVSVRFGTRLVVVVSSPSLANLAFNNYWHFSLNVSLFPNFCNMKRLQYPLLCIWQIRNKTGQPQQPYGCST